MTTGIIYVDQPQTAFLNSSSSSSSLGRSGDRSFLKRLFNRAKSKPSNGPRVPSSLSTSDGKNSMDSRVYTMTPSPHTHPLLAKPSARDEVRRPSGPVVGYTHLDGSIATAGEGFTHARKMAALAMTNGHPSSIADGRRSPLSPASEMDMFTNSLRDREQAAMSAAIEGKYVQEWGFFIKCYAEGRFNISNPPDPPPRRSGFNHLTAPTPPNERERLMAVKACSASLSLGINDKCHRLVLLAKKVFQTRTATISFVDQAAEVFKAEHAFSKKYVDRSASIGAHVLLSNEPMVVLDTAKDWRLRGNPLVKDAPHIRFYAGAPIVTYDGLAIGTFAVSDTQPREAFSAASRRKLMDFARLTMTEIELIMEEREMRERHTPPMSPGRTKAPDVNSWSVKSGARILDGIEQDLQKMQAAGTVSPSSQHKRKCDEPQPASRPRTIRQGNPTPIVNIPKAEIVDRPSRTSVMMDDMPTPPHTPSRPFSISTLGSLKVSLPITPQNSLEATPSASPAPHQYADDTSSMSDSQCQNVHAGGVVSGSRENPCLNSYSPGPITSMAEATFATSIIARSLNYDLVYLLRVSPVRQPEMPLSPYDDATHCPGDNVTTKVLVAHGLPSPPPIFDANLHLRALRSVGGLIYQNPALNSEHDDVGYQLGILLPLLRDGVSSADDEGYGSTTNVGNPVSGGCTGGIVLAAFTRKGDRQVGEPFTADEVRFLREFGEAMKDILLRADGAI